MKKKNLLIILLVFVMGVMMTACGGGDADSGGSDDGAGQDAASGGFTVDLTDFTFSDDKSSMKATLNFDNQTEEAITPEKVISVTAVQDGEELTLPEDSLLGPALGGTTTGYELDYKLKSDSPIQFTVTSLEDNSELLTKEVNVE